MTPRQAGRSSLTLPLILAALCLILAAATWFALHRDAPDARELVPAPSATETDSAPPQVVESALEEPAERTLPSLLRLHGVVLEHDGTPCRRARALHVSLQLQGAWTTAKFAVDDEGKWTFARTVRLDPVHAGTLLLTVPRRVEKELRFTAQKGT